MGALQKIRVVDFGHYVAGPVTGMLLADQGADVIKIDPPGGPRYNTEANATWNRGKRSLALDLQKPDDLAIAKSLAARADVVIENFRPGVMDRLGLGEADLRTYNRGLIYCSIPGFGPEDARAAMPAWEGVVMAATDCFRPAVPYREMIQQLHRKPSQRPGAPTFTAEPVASMFAAMLSATGIAAALNVRGITGRGQRVQVPLFDAMVQATGTYAMAKLPFKPTYGSAVTPWNHQYQCADDRWVHIALTMPNQIEALLELVEPAELRALLQEQHKQDGSDHSTITPALNAAFRLRTATEWEASFFELGLPGVMCRSGSEWIQDSKAVEGLFLMGVESPDLGETVQPAPLVRLSAKPPVTSAVAPRPNEFFEDLVTEASLPMPPLDRSTTPISAVTGPLRGFRVLDLGTGLAGPMCGRTLAEFGAEVIKVDDPTSGSILHHHDVNRGKQSMLLDLENDDDYERLLDLVTTADVVIESFPPGDAEDLGLDYESLKEENQEIIYVSVTAYGDHGPMAERPGSAETVDALTGLQVRYGGSDNPTMWPYPAITEYGTGYAAAFGVIMGLLDRRISGEGTRVHATMGATAGLIQSTFLINHRSKRWDEPSGWDRRGSSPIQGLYQCEDGWIYLGARDAAQLEPMFDDVGDGLEGALIEWCSQRSAGDAVDRLVKHGMGAHELAWLNDAMTDPVVVRRGLSLIRDHGGTTGLLRTTGPGAWLSRSMISPGTSTSPVGSDTETILARLKPRPDEDEDEGLGTRPIPGAFPDAESETESDADEDAKAAEDGGTTVGSDADADLDADRLADETDLETASDDDTDEAKPSAQGSGSGTDRLAEVFEPIDLAKRGEGEEGDGDHGQGSDSAEGDGPDQPEE